MGRDKLDRYCKRILPWILCVWGCNDGYKKVSFKPCIAPQEAELKLSATLRCVKITYVMYPITIGVPEQAYIQPHPYGVPGLSSA